MFLRESKQPHAQQPVQNSWKQSVISSWKNRGGGSIVGISDGTAATTESPLQDSNTSLETAISASIQPLQYEDLLLLPPKKISFVLFNNNGKRNEIDKMKKNAESIGNIASSEEKDGTDCLSIGTMLGVNLIKNPKTKLFEVKDHNLNSNEGCNRPFLSPQLAIMLLPGDVLESINGVACWRSRDTNELCQKIVKQQNEQVTLSLTFVTKATVNSDSQQLQQEQSKQPVIHQVTFVTQNIMEDAVKHEVEEIQCEVGADAERSQDASPTESQQDSYSVPHQRESPGRLKLNTTLRKLSDGSNTVLRLESISSDSWLNHTCARSNDVVLAVNNIPCYELCPDDADNVLNTMTQTHPVVNLKFYTPPLTRRESIRRAAVATAGGTMVGAGAIMMVTPLHPIGHAMAIGGLGVLGTEFEGPKKAFTKMGDAVRRRTKQEPMQVQKDQPSQQSEDPE
jgi:hypothetical protein